MEEEDNVLRILKEARQAISENDSYKIKQLSNQTIHTATISQDPDNVIVAVLVYSLAKIVERKHYRAMPGWKKFYSEFLKYWDASIEHLEKGELEKYRDDVGKIRNVMNRISSNLGQYIRDVFRKAKINKAFKLYEHGLSEEQTAHLLGVSLWDLAGYIGQSSISEAKVSESLPEVKRIKFTEEMFK